MASATSPFTVLTMIFSATKPVYHADLYRLQDPEELSFIGFDEYLDEPEALVIIE
ncbi:tRNA (adenosine(37)-N6)-threonylcarbamoyltransferase complex ATPase subunit type 1 TsaE, partial [Pseudoalteromonas sp. SIMBA_153]